MTVKLRGVPHVQIKGRQRDTDLLCVELLDINMLQVRLLTGLTMYKAYHELQDTMPVLRIEEAHSCFRRQASGVTTPQS